MEKKLHRAESIYELMLMLRSLAWQYREYISGAYHAPFFMLIHQFSPIDITVSFLEHCELYRDSLVVYHTWLLFFFFPSLLHRVATYFGSRDFRERDDRESFIDTRRCVGKCARSRGIGAD